MKKIKMILVLVLALAMFVSSTAFALDYGYSGTLKPGAEATQTSKYKKVNTGAFKVDATKHTSGVLCYFGIRDVNGTRVHKAAISRTGTGSFTIAYKAGSGVEKAKYGLSAQNEDTVKAQTTGTWTP